MRSSLTLIITMNSNLTMPPLSINNTTSRWILEYQPPTMPLYLSLLVTVSYLLVFLAGIVGNIMVIIVVVIYSDMRTSTNMYLANLSVADFLVLMICLPTALGEFHLEEVWYLGDFMCRLTYFVENLVSSASVLIIMAVTIDRYIAVYKPLSAQSTSTPNRASKVIFGVWMTSVATALPFFVTAHTKYIQYYDATWRSICQSPIDHTWKRIYVITLLLLVFFIPLSILSFLYLFIGIHVHKESIRFKECTNTRVNNAHVNRQQVLFLLIAIVSLFFVFLLPIRVIIIVKCLIPTSRGLQSLGFEGYMLVLSFARIMFYLNSACNPIVYSLVSRKFRNAFKRAFLRRCDQHKRTATYTLANNHRENGSSISLRKSFNLSARSTSQVKPDIQPLRYKTTMI